LTNYTTTVVRLLKKGKSEEVVVSQAHPSDCSAVNDLIALAAQSKRPDFINRLTDIQHGQRRLRRSLHYFNLRDREREQALRLLEDYRRRMPKPEHADFYEMQDVCGRVAGIGSMGRLRYAVLINGKGSEAARNLLLEFKESRPSAYDLYRKREIDPIALRRRAEQVIAMERESQIDSNPYLGVAVDGDTSFQVREIGPGDGRVDVKALKNSSRLEELAALQARILARTHSRAIMRGIGTTNPLAALGAVDSFHQRTLAFALAYGDLMQRDWTRFVGERAALENCEQWAPPQPA
jgi:uncharacterized protein (DUF2252 family)